MTLDVDVLYYSGIALYTYTHENTSDRIGRAFGEAIQARKIIVSRNPSERPLYISLHKAAEDYWNEHWCI